LSVAESAPRGAHIAGSGHVRLLPLTVVIWAATAAALLAMHPRVFDTMSTDDLMRLVEVRDFLAGQSWFDLTQYRLHPPFGVAMHWSRIVDLPIAALILLLSPVLGRASAEIVVSALWPLLLLLPVLALAGVLARRLSNAMAVLPTILLIAVSAPVLVHFWPGALDHHGCQIMLLLATLCGVTDRGDARLWPMLGGLAAAVSIAIGVEMGPALAAILAAVGLRWAIEGERAAKLTASFGLAFGAGTAALFAATIPISHWSLAVCDQISIPFVAAAGFSGGLLALLATAGSRINSVALRLAAGIVAGGGACAVVVWAFPACLQNPFAHLDPRVAAVWLANVAETQNVFTVMRHAPGDVLQTYGPGLAALGLALAAMWRASWNERAIWFAPVFTLIVLFIVSLGEVRGGAGATMVARPLIAAAVICLFGVRASLWASHGAMFVLLALSSPVLAVTGKTAGKVASYFNLAHSTFYMNGPLACRGLEDVAPLKALPPGLVVSYIDLGSSILAGTRHSVLAAPYHRNIDGNRIDFNILLGDDATAKRLLAENHVDYVAICPGTPERYNLKKVAPDGLSERLSRGEVPPYLVPVPGDAAEHLKIFRVH
jgi:hypothetical protein